MKKTMILSVLLLTGFTFAQQVKPILEQKDDLVKATYHYANGQIQQEGFFKDGKLTGQWIAYDENGNKKSIGEYTEGQKTGKWFFWNDNSLSEVDYSKSKIENVKAWTQQALVKN
jgi:antitoxin component YwqK of YwqJK toxin-antitoxin module